MATRDIVVLDEQGEIRAAYPFSPVPTRHRVTWKGGSGAYAMCAIDALGMSAMLGVPVTISSSEPGAERAVTVEVDHDTARWQPNSAVVFAGDAGDACCPSVDRTCDHINFFTTSDAAREWAANNPGVTGVVLDQEQALACGVAEFGSLLRPLDAAAFDQGWLEVMERTPFVRLITGLVGLTRLGLRPARLDRLARIVRLPVDEVAVLLRDNTSARVADGLIHWEDPFPGERPLRTLYVEGREIPMRSGCAPDLFLYAAVLDVPFRAEEPCAATGTPIRIDFVPGGYDTVVPAEAVTVLLPVTQVRKVAGASFDEINAEVCTHQPFFASAEAARSWLTAHPGGRVVTVDEMFERSWLTYYRDTLRPLIHPSEH